MIELRSYATRHLGLRSEVEQANTRRCPVCRQRFCSMLVLRSRCLCHAVRTQPLFVRRLSVRPVACMYADRVPRQRHANHKANVADFGMGDFPHRSRSPAALFTRAAATGTQLVACSVAARSHDKPVLPQLKISSQIVVLNADADATDASVTDPAAPSATTEAAPLQQVSVARRIYVGNLAFTVTWQDLKAHFQSVGPGTAAELLGDLIGHVCPGMH